MRAQQASRIAVLVALASALTACGAVDKVQRDMARDWQSIETSVLNKKDDAKNDGERAVASRALERKPMPPDARPDIAEPFSDDAELVDLRKRAEAGEAEAAYELGFAYDIGDGVARDSQAALRWYRSAAEKGHALGALNAGVLYDSGTGVERDAATAAVWYRRAADEGNGRAAYNLAQLYETGEGVPRDAKQAAEWYDKARRTGIANDDDKLAALTPRAPVAPLTRETLAPFQPPHATASTASKVPDSLRLALAIDYAVGRSAPDDQLVADAIRAAAQAGDLEAACNIGMRYVNGRGVARDWAQGESWLRRAAQQGYAPAQTNLAMLLASEQNPHADSGEALLWASKAASAGYGPARAQLGMMYAIGRGVARDSRMADFWLASAERDMREPPGSCKGPRGKETVTAG